jgi:hypothetical protein
MNTASTAVVAKPAYAARVQSNKLLNKEKGWKWEGDHESVTTRTRHGGNGRPTFVHRKKAFIEPVSDNDIESEQEDVDEDAEVDEILEPLPVAGAGDTTDVNDDDDDDPDYDDENKPKHTHAILEVVGLMDTLVAHCRCPCCDAGMNPSLSTLCLSSTITLECSNEICGCVHRCTDSAQAKVGSQVNRTVTHNRSTDYAINVLWVLGFISVGDGCTEAGRLLGILGLPNDTTMESRSFTIIEARISLYIH